MYKNKIIPILVEKARRQVEPEISQLWMETWFSPWTGWSCKLILALQLKSLSWIAWMRPSCIDWQILAFVDWTLNPFLGSVESIELKGLEQRGDGPKICDLFCFSFSFAAARECETIFKKRFIGLAFEANIPYFLWWLYPQHLKTFLLL